MRKRAAKKPALIQGNMTAKPERQQSHRISLFPGLQHVRSRQCQIERMNHLLTCRNNIHAKDPSLWKIPRSSKRRPPMGIGKRLALS
jgi:hypothetical protein